MLYSPLNIPIFNQTPTSQPSFKSNRIVVVMFASFEVLVYVRFSLMLFVSLEITPVRIGLMDERQKRRDIYKSIT